jgi:type II secretory pathway pseudopilin PulG
VKQNIVVGIVLIGVSVLAFAAYSILPSLQDSQRTVDAQAAEGVERAARLLARYSATVDRTDLLLNDLAAVGVDVDVEDPDGLLASSEDEVLEALQDLLEAHGQAMGSKPGARASDIRQGVSGRDELITDNEQLLADALNAVNAALRSSVGDATARDYLEGLRLKGAILQHQGEVEHRRAAAERAQVLAYRVKLAELGREAASLQPLTTVASDSGLDEQIQKLEARATQVRADIEGEQVDLAALQTRVDELSRRLATAQKVAQAARAKMEQMQAKGVDLTAASGAEQFAIEYRQEAARYRGALREAAAIEHGTLPDAKIDASGDYLHGTYQDPGKAGDPAIEFGLQRYRDMQAAQQVRLDGMREELRLIEEAAQRLNTRREQLAQVENDAKPKIAALRLEAKELLQQWAETEASAEALEEAALELFDESEQISIQATRAGGSGWTQGYVEAQVADAAMGAGLVYYDRYRASLENAGVLQTWVEPLGLDEQLVTDQNEAAASAAEEGVAQATAAIESLEQAHRQADRNWTLVAQAAEAKYLLSQFGHRQYLRDAIETYRSALKGREEEGYASTVADRLEFIEQRR